MDRKWWTLAAVCIGVFMLLLDVTIVNVALPAIDRAFNANLSDLQWVIDAYALTLAALLMTAGSLADLLGRRKIFSIGIAVFTLGSTLCGVAPDPTFLALSRGLQGVGGAIMFATSLALLAQAFKPAERGTAFGVFGAVTGVALAVGPVLGGAITSALSWRWIFFVNVPVGVIALAITLMKVQESKLDHARRPDIPGFVTFSISLAALVYGLIKSQDDGWGSATVLVSLIVSVALFLAFVMVQRTSDHPMFDLHLLRVPTFNGGLVAGFAISASIFSLFTYLTIYIQGILGYSAIQAGIRFLPFTGVTFVTAAIAGRLTTKVQIRYLIGGGFLLLTISLLMMRGITPTDGWRHLAPGFIVGGVACGLINVPLASTAVGVVPQQQAGMASGANATARQVGIATGVAALGTILASIIKSDMGTALSRTVLSGHAHQLGAAVSSGAVAKAATHVPPADRLMLYGAARVSYVDALNTVLLIGAVTAAVATVITFFAIRSRDFYHVQQQQTADAAPAVV